MSPPTRHVLIVASRTATSDELRAALLARSRSGPSEFTLLLPAPAGAGEAGPLLREAVERLRGAGLDVVGMIGDADPFTAVAEVWDPREFDELVLATLAPERSHWLTAGVLARLGELVRLPVTHVVAHSIA